MPCLPVLVSRAVHLQPGYCYGLIAGAVFVSEISDHEDGRVLALATVTTMAVGVLAWIYVLGALATRNPGWGVPAHWNVYALIALLGATHAFWIE